VTRPYTPAPGGLVLAVRLTPRAGRDRVDGVKTNADGRPALHLRLAAPPVDGAANRALVAFFAAALGLRQAEIAIHSGETARLKVLHLSGDPAALADRVDALIARAGGGPSGNHQTG
jgi:uncharacterized protein